MGIIDLSSLSDYTPHEGGHDYLGISGTLGLKVASCVADMTPAGPGREPRQKLVMSMIVTDEDFAGRKLQKHLVIGGVDSNGRPMMRFLGDALMSAGQTVEQVHALAANGAVDATQLADMFAGATVYAIVKDSVSNKGNPVTDVDFFVSAARHAEDKASGAWRQKAAPALAPVGAGLNAATAKAVPSLGGLGTI